MSEWQPIETAPKDGTRVILAKISGFATHNQGPYIWWACAGRWSDKWGNWNDDVEPSGLANPTHWMPLPSPPTGGLPE